MKVLDKLEASDVIGIIVIIGGLILTSMHIDTVVGGIMTVTVGYYFGSRARPRKKDA